MWLTTPSSASSTPYRRASVMTWRLASRRPSWRAKRIVWPRSKLRSAASRHSSPLRHSQSRCSKLVAEEAGRLLEARTAATVRFDEDSAVIVGSWSDGEGAGIEVGTLVPYSDPGSPVYRATHEGGRIDDYAELAGEAARLTRLRGYRSAVMAPITADGRLWGTLAVFSASANHFPADAEQRLADFTNLVALALESAEAHDQLTASRARIVEASVAERRTTRTQPPRRRPAAARHPRRAPANRPGNPARGSGRRRGDARQCRRGPEARARGTPRARPRTSSGSPQRPRPRTGPPLAREPRPVPGRRSSASPRTVSTKASKPPSTTSSPRA